MATRIFLDANVLVAVLNKEYPLFTHAARVLSLCDDSRFEVFTSPICLAIAGYFAEKKSGKSEAAKKTAVLCQHLKIAAVDAMVVRQTAANPKVLDFEDGLEYYAAINAGCTFIITENAEDFWFADISVLSCAQFLIEHASRA
jgi:predicted nucleic acid-binding protein